MAEKSESKEIREAIQAGEAALSSLRNAQEKLNSAKNWGIWDIVGGGFMSSLIKHSRMDDAQEYMEEAGRISAVLKRNCRMSPFRTLFPGTHPWTSALFCGLQIPFSTICFWIFTFSHRLIRPVTRLRTPSGRWRTSWTDSAPCHNIFHFTAGQVRPAVCAGASKRLWQHDMIMTKRSVALKGRFLWDVLVIFCGFFWAGASAG